MKLKNNKRCYDLFYTDDCIYFDNTIYRIVYSEGYIGYGFDIFKRKPDWDKDIVAINFEDNFEFIDRKRSTLPFNEVFFKGDKTVYFDEYSNRYEVNRHKDDEDNKELAVLYVIAKSRGIDVSHLYNIDDKLYFNKHNEAVIKSNNIKDPNPLTDKEVLEFNWEVHSDKYGIEDGKALTDKEINKYVNVKKTKKEVNTEKSKSSLKEIIKKMK